MTRDRADEVGAWALAPRGVIIYFNFQQVTAAFSRNFVPYAAVKELPRADGPAAGVARGAW